MSFKTKVKEYLVSKMLWESEADEVIQAMIQNQANESMKDRWDDSTHGYPPIMMNILKVSADAEALNWINKNKPMHFAKPMFDPKLMDEIMK